MLHVHMYSIIYSPHFCICSPGKVLVIHAGGFSQRLPHQSVLGKVFLTLPCGKYISIVFCITVVQYVGVVFARLP